MKSIAETMQSEWNMDYSVCELIITKVSVLAARCVLGEICPVQALSILCREYEGDEKKISFASMNLGFALERMAV